MFDLLSGSVPQETILHFLPYGLPSGFIISTMYRIKVLAAICFIFGWLMKCITDAVINHYVEKHKKPANPENEQEVQ